MKFIKGLLLNPTRNHNLAASVKMFHVLKFVSSTDASAKSVNKRLRSFTDGFPFDVRIDNRAMMTLEPSLTMTAAHWNLFPAGKTMSRVIALFAYLALEIEFSSWWVSGIVCLLFCGSVYARMSGRKRTAVVAPFIIALLFCCASCLMRAMIPKRGIRTAIQIWSDKRSACVSDFVV